MDSTQDPARTDLIELVPVNDQFARWQPSVGVETLALFSHLRSTRALTAESTRRLAREAVSILARCAPPGGSDDSQTGLAVGHIQSGKTMSFTTVAALAVDNAYRLVIVITGISVNLFDQSTRRLRSDLRLDTRDDRKWQHFPNPQPGGIDLRSMRGILAEWSDSGVPAAERQTILATVMKNHIHLTNLINLLQQLDLRGAPALVIDDEADQAGLNTRVQRAGQSTTYRHLLALRRALPHHSYLQYTATPQAPLLINLIDVLSPQFAKVLIPGEDYIGGRQFFIERADQIREIPPHEISTRQAPLREPPPSLVYAMQLFFLGAAAGYVPGPPTGNRTMLVHPSQQVVPHGEYFHWVEQTRHQWERVLALPDEDPDRQDLLAGFKRAETDLMATVPELPPFSDLCRTLPRVVRNTLVQQVNARGGRTPDVQWARAYSFILVGGQAMDRGFTVEGLTITYMPRPVGVGNADTIQQRARFLGYKRSYIGYCRVFLDVQVQHAYERYVRHEENIRAQLEELERHGRPLSEWRRAFFLDNALRPTRREVLDIDYVRGNLSDRWFEPKTPHDSDEATLSNRGTVQQFLARLVMSDDQGHPNRTPMQRHRVAVGIPLQMAFQELLVPFMTTGHTDRHSYLGLQLQVRSYLDDHPDAVCTVYLMSGGRERERTLNARGEIPELFQGANFEAGTRVQIYPGDRAICVRDTLTIQVHRLRLDNAAPPEGPGGARASDVPAVAVWVPRAMSEDWLVQTERHA